MIANNLTPSELIHPGEMMLLLVLMLIFGFVCKPIMICK